MTKKVFSIDTQPGIQRDGTYFDKNFYTDGKWVRFQRGRPRKIGGYRAITTNADGLSRGIYVNSEDGINKVFNGYNDGIEVVDIDNNGVGSGTNEMKFGGDILTTSGLVGGSGYVDGTYTGVALTGGSGVGAVARWHDRLDVMINNAGTALRRPTLELTLEEWNQVMEVNLTGVFLCAQAAGRHMVHARRGCIINTASIMGLSGGGLYPNISYQSTKGAVVNLTRALAVEWAPHQVRVNAVAPTWVRTDFIQPLLGQPELVQRIEGMTPLGRLAEPEDIVAAMLYLASPAASMVTGHTLPVDGGFLAQ